MVLVEQEQRGRQVHRPSAMSPSEASRPSGSCAWTYRTLRDRPLRPRDEPTPCVAVNFGLEEGEGGSQLRRSPSHKLSRDSQGRFRSAAPFLVLA